MTTSMSNLPNHLEEEILSMIPLSSMRAVRLTCKKWNTLFKSRSFTTMHIGKQEAAAKESEESRMVVMMDYNVCLTSVVFVNENENPLTKPLGKLTLLNNEQVKISQVFHCDGLLLCILKDDDTRFVVWNPYLGQTRWIETPHTYNQYKYKYAIGYEKNKSCRSYKILRSRDIYIANPGYIKCYSEIYDFDSNLWTSNNVVSVFWHVRFCDRRVTLKGNTYWCAEHGRRDITHTVCFDFTTNRFGQLRDLPFNDPYDQLVTLSCVRDEKLAVLVQSTVTYVIDIWITDNLEEEKVVWSKFLSVDLGPLTDLRISDGCFFIDEEKKVAMVINKDREERLDTLKIFGEDGYFYELELGKSSDKKKCWPVMCSYVPSLVQVKLPEVGKRKRKRRKKVAQRNRKRRKKVAQRRKRD
ncbi:unnamed protein product [Microthlaspi erraticum]|uniref:F-box domain-containing protein n=1 Tax=Microthlaspi erraticum TaxID=1685480 RepID=A0A6D2K1Q6_9BRAS|nr:unnamed protein product [Microthlaspi erraticum]